jgi:hypothetical protein
MRILFLLPVLPWPYESAGAQVLSRHPMRLRCQAALAFAVGVGAGKAVFSW